MPLVKLEGFPVCTPACPFPDWGHTGRGRSLNASRFSVAQASEHGVISRNNGAMVATPRTANALAFCQRMAE
jgi:hypothetical protein